MHRVYIYWFEILAVDYNKIKCVVVQNNLNVFLVR